MEPLPHEKGDAEHPSQGKWGDEVRVSPAQRGAFRQAQNEEQQGRRDHDGTNKVHPTQERILGMLDKLKGPELGRKQVDDERDEGRHEDRNEPEEPFPRRNHEDAGQQADVQSMGKHCADLVTYVPRTFAVAPDRPKMASAFACSFLSG